MNECESHLFEYYEQQLYHVPRIIKGASFTSLQKKKNKNKKRQTTQKKLKAQKTQHRVGDNDDDDASKIAMCAVQKYYVGEFSPFFR